MRVLFISYPFPPWGGNTRRAVYQANYLVHQGHEVDVLSIQPSDYMPNRDASLMKTVDERVSVHRVFAGLLHHARYRSNAWFAHLMNAARIPTLPAQKLLFPLSTTEWLPYGLAAAVSLHLRRRFDVIYSHGDPLVGNLVGCAVRRLLGVPWTMYISDPRWFAPGASNRSLLYIAERLCLNSADHIVVNCQETMKGYLKHFPFLSAGMFTVLTDGFDEALYTGFATEGGKFRIVFTGRLYDAHMAPAAFFDALVELQEEALEVWVCGPGATDFERLAKARGLDHLVRSHGNLPFERVVDLQLRATVLLAFGRQLGYQVPGKLFEYIGARRPILVIRDDTSDVAAKYVLRYERGLVVDASPRQIANTLRSLITAWKEKKLEQHFDLKPLPEFTLSHIATRFEAVLDQVSKHTEQPGQLGAL